MANIIPSGIDNSTGQQKPVTSSDTLVDSSGNPLIGSSAVFMRYYPTCEVDVTDSTSGTPNSVMWSPLPSLAGASLANINSGVGIIGLSGNASPTMASVSGVTSTVQEIRINPGLVVHNLYLPPPQGSTAINGATPHARIYFKTSSAGGSPTQVDFQLSVDTSSGSLETTTTTLTGGQIGDSTWRATDVTHTSPTHSASELLRVQYLISLTGGTGIIFQVARLEINWT